MRRIPREPIPQVGALLDLDTGFTLPKESFREGCKYWQLNGSCILVAPRKILTVSHVLEKNSPMAAFFPYAGLFKLTSDSLFEKFRDEKERPTNGWDGDRLVLVDLDESVKSIVPLKWRSEVSLNRPA